MRLYSSVALRILFPAALIAAFSFSCRKDEETVAIVTVKDKDGALIQNASVRLWALGDGNNPIRFDTTIISNASGQANFNFTDYFKAGQAGFAVLDIEAQKDVLFGEGLIRIEEMKTNEETVVIK